MSLTVENAVLDGRPASLRAERGLIAELGPEVEPHEGDEVLDAGGKKVIAGTWNAHTHAAMTLFRGYGDDMPLMTWLEEKIWPVEAKLEADDVYWGARLACAEMVHTGTVGFWDMYWQPAATARAVAESGLRAVIGAPLFDGGDSATDKQRAKLKQDAQHSIEELAVGGDRISAALAPHSIYMVSEPSLRWIGEFAAEHELPIHIHLSETEQEVADCVAAHGVRPATYLDQVGLLGPRTMLAHCVWMDDAELDLIAERGATMATNPVANLKLAVGGVFPYPGASARGIGIGLGTDGAGSNNSLDMHEQTKFLALIQKHVMRDPAAAPAGEIWDVATGARSPLLDGSGRVAVGEPADFVLLRDNSPVLSIGELVPNLVYAGNGAGVVDTTVVDGRVLMHGGHLPDLAEIHERAVERAHRLGIA